MLLEQQRQQDGTTIFLDPKLSTCYLSGSNCVYVWRWLLLLLSSFAAAAAVFADYKEQLWKSNHCSSLKLIDGSPHEHEMEIYLVRFVCFFLFLSLSTLFDELDKLTTTATCFHSMNTHFGSMETDQERALDKGHLD